MTQHSHKLQGPHQGQPILHAGDSIDQAKAAMVMMHGRGATAKDIFELVPDLIQPGFAFLAPQAAEKRRLARDHLHGNRPRLA